MRDEILPLIKMWAIRDTVRHQLPWRRPKPKSLEPPRKPCFPRVQQPLLPMASSKSIAVSEGKVTIQQHTPKRLTWQPHRKWLRRERPEAPDPVVLRELSMTEEEYLQRDEHLRQRMLRQEVEDTLAGQTLEEELDRLGISLEDEAKDPILRLDEEQIARVEAAALDAPTVPQPVTKAPWLELKERKQAQASDKGPVKRYEGVVYESMPKKLAKKHKLQLSEESIKRLEEAAEQGNWGEENLEAVKPAVEDSHVF